MKTKSKSCRIVYWQLLRMVIVVLALVCLFNVILQTALGGYINHYPWGDLFFTFMILYTIFFSFIFMVVMSIVIACNGTSVLINFNIDRQTIGREFTKLNIIVPAIAASLSFIGIKYLINSNIIFEYFKVENVFPVNLIDYKYISIMFVLLILIYILICAFCSFITLLGMVHGWYYLVGSILLFFSFIVLIKNYIVKLVLFNDNWIIFIIGFILIDALLTLVNNKMINKVEFKH